MFQIDTIFVNKIQCNLSSDTRYFFDTIKKCDASAKSCPKYNNEALSTRHTSFPRHYCFFLFVVYLVWYLIINSIANMTQQVQVQELNELKIKMSEGKEVYIN